MAEGVAQAAELRLAPAELPIAHGAWHKVLAGIFAFALFLGLGMGLVGAFGIDAASTGPLACCAVAAAAIAACSILFGRGRTELFGYLGMGAILLVACIALSARIADGAAQALNSLLIVLGSRTATFDLPYATSSAANLVIFSCVMSAVLAIACSQMALRGNIVVCLLFVIAMIAATAMGLVPVDAWTWVLAAGVIGCICMNTAMPGNLVDGRAIAAGIGLTLAAGALVAGLVIGISGGTVDTTVQRASLRQAYYNLRYGPASFAMPQGQLNGLGTLQATDRPALTVLTSASTKEYLRGFVGESYSNGTWSNLPDDAVLENQGLFYWLGQDGFASTSQVADAASAAGFAQSDPEDMSISYAGARGGYAYLPYAYMSGASYTTTTDEAQAKAAGSSLGTGAGNSSGQASFAMDGSLLRKSYLIQDAVASEQDKASGDLGTYLADEGAYRDFVYGNYLSIPSDVADTFQSLFGSPKQLSAEVAKAQVESDLASAVSYDAEVVTDNGSTDFVTYFLTQSKSGYCVHYATAAALLMRYYGVPARYVEGYLLDTASSDGATSFELTEGNAHAWVEYYLDGVGWIPFDVTPGHIDDSFYEVTDNVSVQYSGAEWSVGDSGADSTWSPEVVQDEKEEQDEQQGPAGNTTAGWMLLWSLAGLLAVLLAALIARTMVLRHRLKGFLGGLSSGSPREAVGAAFSYGLFLGERCLGQSLENRPYRAQGASAEERRLCSEATFDAAADANARALFSEGEIGEEDRQSALRFVEEVRNGLHGQANPFKRFYLRWIRCYY